MERVYSTCARFAAALAGIVLAGCASLPADVTVTAIVGATVVHVDREGASAAAGDSTILIEGNRIVRVGPASTTAIPPGATRIDARGKWVVPGLVDAHVHFFQSGNLYTRPDAADFNAWMPYEREVRRNQARLEATFKVWIASGVTSVADVGGPFWNFSVREAARKSPAAPRMAVAGPLISMVDRVKLDLGDPPIIKITSVEESRALVRRELAYKPDFIKVWFIHRPGDDLAAQEAIVRAAGDDAHAAGVRLAVHATELVVAKAALRAGADFLVHSVEDQAVDEEFLALARRNKAIYCPTLFVTSGYQYALSNTWKPTEAEQRLGDPEILAAMGDLARIPKGQLPERVARAMALMVQAGLTPLQVLRSATVNGAKVMGLERDIGSLEAGKLADLVILDADPLADVANLARIHRVFKDGRAFEPAELLRAIGKR